MFMPRGHHIPFHFHDEDEEALPATISTPEEGMQALDRLRIARETLLLKLDSEEISPEELDRLITHALTTLEEEKFFTPFQCKLFQSLSAKNFVWGGIRSTYARYLHCAFILPLMKLGVFGRTAAPSVRDFEGAKEAHEFFGTFERTHLTPLTQFLSELPKRYPTFSEPLPEFDGIFSPTDFADYIEEVSLYAQALALHVRDLAEETYGDAIAQKLMNFQHLYDQLPPLQLLAKAERLLQGQ